MGDFDPTLTLIKAADGDEHAWNELVTRYSGLVWSVARGFRLNQADAADVFQATWFRLVERLNTIRDGDGLGAWLATTTRREAVNLIRRAGREMPTDDLGPQRVDTDTLTPEEAALRSERDRLIWESFAKLPQRCQLLLRVLLLDPPLSYEDASAALDMPIGSIGPTRARCLKSLGIQVAQA